MLTRLPGSPPRSGDYVSRSSQTDALEGPADDWSDAFHVPRSADFGSSASWALGRPPRESAQSPDDLRTRKILGDPCFPRRYQRNMLKLPRSHHRSRKMNIVERHPPPHFQAPAPATKPLKTLLIFSIPSKTVVYSMSLLRQTAIRKRQIGVYPFLRD